MSEEYSLYFKLEMFFLQIAYVKSYIRFHWNACMMLIEGKQLKITGKVENQPFIDMQNCKTQ